MTHYFNARMFFYCVFTYIDIDTHIHMHIHIHPLLLSLFDGSAHIHSHGKHADTRALDPIHALNYKTRFTGRSVDFSVPPLSLSLMFFLQFRECTQNASGCSNSNVQRHLRQKITV